MGYSGLEVDELHNSVVLAIVAALVGVLAGLSLERRLRNHLIDNRLREGRCGFCGYLRTGGGSDKCPECGRPVPRKPEVAA
jgi:hypothetical protein